MMQLGQLFGTFHQSWPLRRGMGLLHSLPFLAWLILAKACPTAAARRFKLLNPFGYFKNRKLQK